jgi:hypothetical protein
LQTREMNVEKKIAKHENVGFGATIALAKSLSG